MSYLSIFKGWGIIFSPFFLSPVPSACLYAEVYRGRAEYDDWVLTFSTKVTDTQDRTVLFCVWMTVACRMYWNWVLRTPWFPPQAIQTQKQLTWFALMDDHWSLTWLFLAIALTFHPLTSYWHASSLLGLCFSTDSPWPVQDLSLGNSIVGGER